MKLIYLHIFLLAFILNSCAQETYDQMLDKLYSHSVPVIYADSIGENDISKFVILDAREDEEFNISHIKGALHIGYNHPDFSILSNIDTSSTFIVYCTVGYRSEKIGEKLKKKGYTNVFNLYGGIFSWVNSNHKVVDDKGNYTSKVHTYNKKWSRWLKSGEKVY